LKGHCQKGVAASVQHMCVRVPCTEAVYTIDDFPRRTAVRTFVESVVRPRVVYILWLGSKCAEIVRQQLVIV
jgi:hypothetical protein